MLFKHMKDVHFNKNISVEDKKSLSKLLYEVREYKKENKCEPEWNVYKIKGKTKIFVYQLFACGKMEFLRYE